MRGKLQTHLLDTQLCQVDGQNDGYEPGLEIKCTVKGTKSDKCTTISNWCIPRQKLFKRKLPKLLLKLDIAKAFDTVSWPFLLEILPFHVLDISMEELAVYIVVSSIDESIIVKWGAGAAYSASTGTTAGGSVVSDDLSC